MLNVQQKSHKMNQMFNIDFTMPILTQKLIQNYVNYNTR